MMMKTFLAELLLHQLLLLTGGSKWSKGRLLWTDGRSHERRELLILVRHKSSDFDASCHSAGRTPPSRLTSPKRSQSSSRRPGIHRPISEAWSWLLEHPPTGPDAAVLCRHCFVATAVSGQRGTRK